MGTTAEKLQYTKDAVDDIQLAFTEIDVDCPDTDELATYGDKIRNLSNIKVYSEYCDIDAGTWEGATLKDGSWVSLSTTSLNSSWTYMTGFEKNPDNIQFIYVTLYEPYNWFRITRSSSYLYTPAITIGSSALMGKSTSPGNSSPVFKTYSNGLSTRIWFDNYSGTSSSSASGEIVVSLDNTGKLVVDFEYNERNILSVNNSTFKFCITIGYVE